VSTPLRPCPACSRHVRASEPACPFCERELDAAFRSVPSPRAPAVARLSRAALFAIGAGGVAAGTGCGSTSPRVPTVTAAVPGAAPGVAGSGVTVDAGADARCEMPCPAYGVDPCICE
jgi:hypothetical protein